MNLTSCLDAAGFLFIIRVGGGIRVRRRRGVIILEGFLQVGYIIRVCVRVRRQSWSRRRVRRWLRGQSHNRRGQRRSGHSWVRRLLITRVVVRVTDKY